MDDCLSTILSPYRDEIYKVIKKTLEDDYFEVDRYYHDDKDIVHEFCVIKSFSPFSEKLKGGIKITFPRMFENLRRFYFDVEVESKEIVEKEVEEEIGLFGKKITKTINELNVIRKTFRCFPFVTKRKYIDDSHSHPYVYDVKSLDSLKLKLSDSEFYHHFKTPMKDEFRRSLNYCFELFSSVINSFLHKVGNSEVEFKERLKELSSVIEEQVIKSNTNKDLSKLIRKHQEVIVSFEKNHIQKFIKISNHLDLMTLNIKKIFNDLSHSSNSSHDNLKHLKILEESIHTYNSILTHSVSMIISLTKNDLVTFYEIYEVFDKLKLFNTTWENDISTKINEISGDVKEMTFKFSEIIFQMNKIEKSINQGFQNLTYINETSFERLRSSVTQELTSINSSINFNTLIQGVMSYQLHRLNRNTRNLR